MSLTKFVRNVEDLSDDGGFKFRFKCDRCGDGFESSYVAAKTNMLKTALDVFQVFSPFGGRMGNAANDIDRGLRGKERDAAYERAVSEAMVFFKKCTACGNWVCPENCWNKTAGMCDVCAPDSSEAGAKEANQIASRKAVEAVDHGGAAGAVSCPACGMRAHGGKFCEACGASLLQKKICPQCKTAMEPGAKFCSDCGAKL